MTHLETVLGALRANLDVEALPVHVRGKLTGQPAATSSVPIFSQVLPIATGSLADNPVVVLNPAPLGVGASPVAIFNDQLPEDPPPYFPDHTVDSAPVVGPITAETFDWGFHLEIPDDTLKMIVGSASAGSTLLSISAGISGPAAPFIGALATFVSIAASACDSANIHRTGIYISMLWAVPGVFVPTPRPPA